MSDDIYYRCCGEPDICSDCKDTKQKIEKLLQLMAEQRGMTKEWTKNRKAKEDILCLED